MFEANGGHFDVIEQSSDSVLRSRTHTPARHPHAHIPPHSLARIAVHHVGTIRQSRWSPFRTGKYSSSGVRAERHVLISDHLPLTPLPLIPPHTHTRTHSPPTHTPTLLRSYSLTTTTHSPSAHSLTLITHAPPSPLTPLAQPNHSFTLTTHSPLPLIHPYHSFTLTTHSPLPLLKRT